MSVVSTEATTVPMLAAAAGPSGPPVQAEAQPASGEIGPIAFFDVAVLQPFSELEALSESMGGQLEEAIGPFREAVFLQREFLRLVCQVHRNHEEAVRVVDETKEHVDNVKYVKAQTKTTDPLFPHLCGLLPTALLLLWIDCGEADGPTDNLVTTATAALAASLEPLRTASNEEDKKWAGLVTVIHSAVCTVIGQWHSPRVGWGEGAPLVDLDVRPFPAFDFAVSKPDRDRITLERAAFDSCLRELSASTSRKFPRPFDYVAERSLGEGAFGQVSLVKSGDGAVWACKVMDKSAVVNSLQVEHAIQEKNVLLSCQGSPFIVTLHAHHQDRAHLYLIFEFVSGGELLHLLRKQRNSVFTADQCRYATLELVFALEYLHNLHVVYRDIKPENVLLDGRGHLKLTDFGFAKRLNKRTWTMCGTPEYMAPEIVENKGHGFGADWWSLGVFLFEIRSGFTPFSSSSEVETYQKIYMGDYRFPSSPKFDDVEVAFVQDLLRLDATDRLGCRRAGSVEVIKHPFFKSLDVGKMRDLAVPSPFAQLVHPEGDVGHLDLPKEPLVWDDPKGGDDYGATFDAF